MNTSASVLYEVSITVEASIRSDFLSWLNHHMREMLEIDGFAAAALFVDTEDTNTFVCHYRLRDLAAMEAYLDGPAQEMRADETKRFGEAMSAKRRILQIVD
ncbi:MAG: DUF4286 family protein [Hyphococcus sp.]